MKKPTLQVRGAQKKLPARNLPGRNLSCQLAKRKSRSQPGTNQGKTSRTDFSGLIGIHFRPNQASTRKIPGIFQVDYYQSSWLFPGHNQGNSWSKPGEFHGISMEGTYFSFTFWYPKRATCQPGQNQGNSRLTSPPYDHAALDQVKTRKEPSRQVRTWN